MIWPRWYAIALLVALALLSVPAIADAKPRPAPGIVGCHMVVEIDVEMDWSAELGMWVVTDRVVAIREFKTRCRYTKPGPAKRRGLRPPPKGIR